MISVDAVSALRSAVGDRTVAVAGVGRSAYAALAAWGDSALPLDALGDPVPVGVGLAMALQGTNCEAVITIEGDGSFLFGLTCALASLSSVRMTRPRLLAVVVDNGVYESGGGHATRTFPLSWSHLVTAFHLPYAEVNDVDAVQANAGECWGGVLRLVVSDEEPLPPPGYLTTGAERTALFRQMLRTRFGVQLAVPASKY